jgi:Fe-S cluster biosynthesis and repair protein YggX
MADFTCVRCGKSGPALDAPPMPGPMGTRVFETICAACWQDWLKHQTSLINHYALNLQNADARRFLTQQSETFLFASPINGA